MPAFADRELSVRGKRSGTWTLPCDGGATTLGARLRVKIGWTAAEAGPPPVAAPLLVELVDSDIFGKEVYASATVNASQADPPGPAPAGVGVVIGPAITKWTQYTVRFVIFCAKGGCIVCARDGAGIVGSHGETGETFRARFTLGGLPAQVGGGVTVTCDPNAAAATYAADVDFPLSEEFVVAPPQSSPELAVAVDRIVQVRVKEALIDFFNVSPFQPLAEELDDTIDSPTGSDPEPGET